ncbi:tandem-95 repeat protein, partial [Novipirellula rosea]|uniref:tandem-95 repeat protein n=1 Tax=Novipirellula rosea TaxID=1031540 RepID=UPI0031EC4400
TVEITNSGLTTIASGANFVLDGAFTQNGTGLVSTGGDITTINDDISFATAVTLTDDVSLNTGTGVGDVTFGSTIGGTFALQIEAGTGDVSLLNDAGAGALDDLASLSITGAEIQIDDVTTAGTIYVCGDTLTTTGSLATDGTVTSTITLIADDMTLLTTATINSGDADTDVQTKTDAQPIDLGTDSTLVLGAPDRLGLSSAELATFRTSSTAVLRIGTVTQSAGIDLSAAVLFDSAELAIVSLVTDGDVTTTGGSIAVRDLAVNAGGSVTLDGANDVNLLAINAAVGNITFVDVDGFSVGTVDSVVGVVASAGTVTLTAGNTGATAGENDVNVNESVTATGDATVSLDGEDAKLTIASSKAVASSGEDVTITTDKIDIQGTVSSNATTGVVTIETSNDGQTIELGTTGDGTDTLALDQAEINRITTSKLVIGRDDASPANASGDITVTQSIAFAFAMAPVVKLVTGASIKDQSNQTITANKLALVAKTGVGSLGNLLGVDINDSVTPDPDQIIAAVNTISGGVYLTSDSTITVDTVDGVVGIQSTGGAGVGDIALNTTADGADIVINNDVKSNGEITIDADANDPMATNSTPDGGGITIAATANVGGLTGPLADSITLRAEDNLTVSDVLAVNMVSVTSTAGAIVDDGVENTRLQGASVTLEAATFIGSNTDLTLADVVAGNVQSAVDVNLTSPTGSLSASVPASGGNVQINEVGGFATGDGQLIASQVAAQAGDGKQLAIINSGGSFLIDDAVTITTHNLLLGTVGNVGNRLLTVSNSITITDGTLSLGSQSGDVVVGAAISSSGDLNIQTGNSDIALNAVVESTAAGIDVTSGGDISVGSVGDLQAIAAGFDIALTADGNVVVAGGGDLDAGADEILITVGQDGSPGLAEIRGDLVAGSGTTLTGGTGDDIFIVEPSTTTTFAVRGDANVGDDENDMDALLVDVDAVGAIITSGSLTPESGTYTFAGAFKDITYDDIESLDGLPPTEIEDIDPTSNSSGGSFVFNGSVNEGTVANNDYVGLQADSDSRNGTDITYSLDDDAGGRFKIVNNNLNSLLDGRILVANASLIDFEASGGSYKITIRATDESGLFTTKTFTIQVVNAAPTARDDAFTTFENSLISGANVLLANPAPSGIADSDPNGGTLTVTEVSNGATSVGSENLNVGAAIPGTNGGTFRIFSNGNLAFDPGTSFDYLADGAMATTTVTYTISDGNLTSTATVTVTVLGTNDAPTLVPASFNVAENAANGALVGNIGQILSGSDTFAETIDPDSSVFTYTIVGGNGFGPNAAFAISNAGDVTVANSSAIDADIQNNYTLIISVTDDKGATGYGLVFIAVNPTNDPPIIHDDFMTTNEDTAVTFNVLANDSDPEFDSLTVASVTIDGGVPITDFGSAIPVTDGATTLGSLTVNANGLMVFTPAANYYGPVSFDYTTTDGTTPVTGTVNINVVSVNDAPVAVDDSPTAVDEDTPIMGNVLTNDSDVETLNANLTASVVNGPANGTVQLNANGTFTYTPNENWNGTDSFTYQVRDAGGGTDIGLVTLTVNPVNDAPVANDLDLSGPLEDAEPANGAINLTLGTDLPFAALATDDATVLGAANFDFGIGQNGAAPDTANVTITIDGVRHADEPLAVSYNSTSGALELDPSSALSSPLFKGLANGQVAVVNIKFGVTDGTLSDVGNITFKVEGVNDAPIAVDDVASTAEDTPVSGDVSTNDSDVDTTDMLVYALATAPTNGSVVLGADGTYTYTPAANFNGIDTFTYTVVDGRGGSDTGLVTVTVNPVNDAPIANDLDLSGPLEDAEPANGAINLTLGTDLPFAALATDDATVLGAANFDFGIGQNGAAPDTANVTITIGGVRHADEPLAVSYNSTSGALELDPSSVLSSPLFKGLANGQVAVVNIKFGVTDGTLSDVGNITFKVEGVNDAPVLAAIGAQSIDEGATLAFTAIATDIDMPVQNLTFSLANGTSGSVPAGAVINPATGVFTWTP